MRHFSHSTVTDVERQKITALNRLGQALIPETRYGCAETGNRGAVNDA